MKYSVHLIVALYALFIASPISAQKETPPLPIDSISGKISYTEVIFIDDSLATKNELYSRAREWFAKAYKSSTDVIQMEDKESGKIVGKALMQVYHKALGSNFPSGYIHYTISIYLKDGRYKYEVSDFYHKGQYVSGGNRIPDYGPCENMIKTKDKTLGLSHQRTYNYYLTQMDSSIQLLIEDLKMAMNTKAKGSSNDDW